MNIRQSRLPLFIAVVSIPLACFGQVPEAQKQGNVPASRPTDTQPGPQQQTLPQQPPDPALENITKLIEDGHYADAEAAARTLLAQVEASAGRDSPRAANVLEKLSFAMSRAGKSSAPETRELAERAVRVKEENLGPGHLETAKSLVNLGMVLREVPDYAAAEQAYTRALAIAERPPVNDRLMSQVLRRLANLYIDRGQYAPARPLLERSLSAAEKTGDPRDVATILASLAFLHKQLGQFTEARRLYERALEIREKNLGPEHPEVAMTLILYGGALRQLGDYKGAKAAWERSLRIEEKVLGPDHPQVASSLAGLAIIAIHDDDLASAQALNERALAIQEKHLGPDHPDVENTIYNLAFVVGARGDVTRARKLYERALAIQEKLFGPDHPKNALILDRLATMNEDAGDLAGARAALERAVAIKEKTLGPGHPSLIFSLGELAFLLMQVGEDSKALQLGLRLEQIGRDQVQMIVPTLPEQEALRYVAGRPSGFGIALTLATEHPDKVPAAGEPIFDSEIRSRALLFSEFAARNRELVQAESAEAAVLVKQVASARERLAKLALRGPSKDTPEGYRAALQQARQEEDRIERALAEKSVLFREERTRSQQGLQEVAAAVPANAALVAFFRYERLELGWKGGRDSVKAPSYVAFVLRRGETEPRLVPLGKAEEIDHLIAAWSEQLRREARSRKGSGHLGEAAYRAIAARLRRKIWDSLLPSLHGAKRVFIVPDGALNLVNFAALPIGQTSYLIEKGPVIHYLSAERDLVPTAPEPRNQGLFALGGPAFDDTGPFASLTQTRTGPAVTQTAQLTGPQVYRGNRSACGQFQSMRFEALPGSRRETDQIVSLWERSAEPGKPVGASNAAPMPGVVYLKGAEASETAFKQRAPGYRVLHLATHGFFLGGRCASALDAKGPGDAPPSAAAENPLLLSGLVLAGANHRQAAGPEEDDGILTAEEIAAMNLEGVEWAVLSGCDTGVGEIQAGEGVFGLRRAFQIAGAHTVIMSLWPVEDNTARQWMTTLYRQRFVRGLSTAESVREASLTVLRRRRARQQSTHPFYWGGFVAAGDWR